MAQIIGGGEPVNDAERAVIAHLRDHGPAHWVVLHNFDLRLRGNRNYEIDILVVSEYAVTLIDVKGTRGRVEVMGGRWYPDHREPFRSPVEKLRGHAKALKGNLTQQGLGRVFVDALVVMPFPDSQLVDRSAGPDADAQHVVIGLDDLVPELGRPERIRPPFLRDIRQHGNKIVTEITGIAERRAGPLRFGHWEVIESLGETEEVTEYRARNADAPGASAVLLRVYHADPYQPADLRGAERMALANAYNMLLRLPSDPCVVACRDFFPNEDESQYVLVLEDVRAGAVQLNLTDPQRALSMDAKLRLIKDMLHGLAHAHANKVLHRAISPATVLVTQGGGGMLTGFDYARPEDPRSNSVIARLAEVLDPAYLAPECQNRPERMSRASDVYAAGVVAYQLLTGELPFTSSVDQYQRSSALPLDPMTAIGLPERLIDLLQRMCAQAPGQRPTATQAEESLVAATRSEPVPAPQRRMDYRNLPEGYQLTRKYTVQRKVGGGAFGVVYQVYDNLADADRAIKIVDRDRDSNVARAVLEYRNLLALPAHPNVVRVESADYLDGQDVPYLVFEYLDGKDVSDLVKERALGAADTVRLGIEVATGLAFLHANGVNHCDIKPSNLLWTDQGAKIIDFNVAVRTSSSLSGAGGSPRYAPPDVSYAGPPSAADLIDRDVYGLGVTLYEVLTGRYPFSSRPTLGETAPDPRLTPEFSELSDELVRTLLRAIKPLRSDRYGSAEEFLAALRAVGEVHRRPAPPPASLPVPAPAAANVNPFVDHLQTLYSQSPVSNAGTRGTDAYGTYVATALDSRLIPDVLTGRYRLVIITGNAGDGKTAFLERLVEAARGRGAEPGQSRVNGVDLRLPDGRTLRTNNDGSQDEGDRANDDVLLEFFAPFTDGAAVVPAETRLIAINTGRLVDFLTEHAAQFTALTPVIHAGLAGQSGTSDIALVNLNQRSLVAGANPVFDRVLAELTSERYWAACAGCELALRCYAPHNARTFGHPSAGPKVTSRLRELYRLVHLRGQLHVTLRDLRSALAFMLTSGRDCAQIHELYRAGSAPEILASFYFNSWLGEPATADRLLRQLGELDVAAVPQPALDRRLAAMGPAAGQAMMTIDQRGGYDLELLAAAFARLGQNGDPAMPDAEYLAAARRRFYFESVDDQRARAALPFRAAERFLRLLTHPADLPAELPALVTAINRGEGLPDADLVGGNLALAIRDVPGGTIREYRLFPPSALTLTAASASTSPYVESEPECLELTAEGPGGHRARLRIRLDLFELLQHQRDGYLPSVAELQGRYLDLVIFKNELSAAPYQEVILTTDGKRAHRIRREADGRLVMTPLARDTVLANGERLANGEGLTGDKVGDPRDA